MAAAGFYDDREAAEAVVDPHQALMWEVGDLMNQWEALQAADVLRVRPRPSASFTIICNFKPFLHVADSDIASAAHARRCTFRGSWTTVCGTALALRRLTLTESTSRCRCRAPNLASRTPPVERVARQADRARRPDAIDPNDDELGDRFFRHLVFNLRNGVLAITATGAWPR